jgi:hypothetical protein
MNQRFRTCTACAAGRSPALVRNWPAARCRLQPFALPSHLEPPKTPQSCGSCRSKEEVIMFALTEISRSTQRAVCMLLAAVIVVASLSLGEYGAQPVLHGGYSVTVTQLR